VVYTYRLGFTSRLNLPLSLVYTPATSNYLTLQCLVGYIASHSQSSYKSPPTPGCSPGR